MSEPLQHDPRTKLQIKEALYKSLYDPVHEHFKKRIDAIILKNTSLISSSHKSFTYKGDFYSMDQTRPPLRLNRLVRQLYPLMDEYLKDKSLINSYELPYVSNFLNRVLNVSNSLQDYLDILPSSIHGPIEDLVNTCPCCHRKLTPELAEEFKNQNQEPINLIKQRMVKNLIL